MDTSNGPIDPRQDAISFLRARMNTGLAGVDPYDEAILIAEAPVGSPAEDETRKALDELGLILNESPRGRHGQTRFRAILEADVRHELRLDAVDAPTMRDEALASRAVGTSAAIAGHDRSRRAGRRGRR